MRLIHSSVYGITGPYTAEEAVAEQIDMEAGLREGELERLQAKIDALAGIVGRLLDAAVCAPLRPNQIAEIVGYSWEAEKD